MSVTKVENSNDVLLDPRDPFESALIDIVKTNRKKRADYARDGDMFSNFEAAASIVGVKGFGVPESILHLIGIKLARLHALKENGREPQNESTADTYLDLAVYSCILLAWIRWTHA